jgi:hypothetical protein
VTEPTPSPEDVRSIARFELSTILDARNRLMDEHAASFRWLTASLFAANGGALVALVGSEIVPPYAKLWAGFWFAGGVLFSLLTAWFNQRLVQKMIQPMVNLISFWGCVAHGMEFDDEKHGELITAVRSSTQRSWPVQASGWAAALVFVAGMTAAGTGLRSATQSQATAHVAPKAAR